MDHARGGMTDYRTAYLWLDAGQSWPFLRLRGSETIITNRALCGWLIVVSASVCWAAIMMTSGGMRPMEATIQIERLVEALERTTAIPAATANDVARIIGQPWYDCRHVACSGQLAARNRASRTRLKDLLASKVASNELALNANTKPIATAADVGH
jgi:hypothetical protein